MGTARKFSRILHREIDVHAAWMPVANSFALGDYGVISDGVFARLGNIDEFGVTFSRVAGRPARLRFRSEGTRVRRFVAGVETNVLPAADIDAKLVIEFAVADAFYVDALQLEVEEMADVAEVGRRLHAIDGWRRRWKVVHSTYTAANCTILSSRSADSRIELSGTANALQLLELGRAEAEISVSAEDSVGLEVVGESGVLGLRLFQLRLFGDGPRLLGPGDPAEPVVFAADEDLADDV